MTIACAAHDELCLYARHSPWLKPTTTCGGDPTTIPKLPLFDSSQTSVKQRDTYGRRVIAAAIYTVH